MIRIREISMMPEHNPLQLQYEASRLLRISSSAIKKVQIVKRSIDARKKPDVRIVYTVDVAVDGNEKKILKNCGCKRASVAPISFYKPPVTDKELPMRPVVVGFGPAGMFAGLILALAGLKPIILERGEDADSRSEKVTRFFETGELDCRSNVQFGEGGAGTFSDGKLNTGVNNPRIGWILNQFVAAGAGEEILYDAKPHIGTDVLLTVVKNIRRRIQSLGGEIRFSARVNSIEETNGCICAVILENGERILSNHVILAIGHSARDTFAMLFENKISMEPKPFSMGVRIEHKQSMVDRSQYGNENQALPPADYKLVKHLQDKTVYTFCMCPGGYVVAAASEENSIVTNGMSYSDRAGENANAALLVTLNPQDFPFEGPLGGMYWQRQIEQAAYAVSGTYKAPAQLVGDFLANRPSGGCDDVKPTYKPGVTWCDLHNVLPPIITDALKEAIPLLNGSLAGFADPGSVLTAPETRSSSPVRIIRDETKQSVSLKGLYPAGEGAGYAGGIMSAAIDGIMCAEALIENI